MSVHTFTASIETDYAGVDVLRVSTGSDISQTVLRFSLKDAPAIATAILSATLTGEESSVDLHGAEADHDLRKQYARQRTAEQYVAQRDAELQET